MSSIVQGIYSELVKTWRNPARVRELGDWGKVLNLVRSLKKPGTWVDGASARFQVRRYRSYDAYLKHQRSKQPLILRTDYDVRFREALRQRLERGGTVRPGMSVLCLGARSGAEVGAFVDLGCFAVGIDINPTASSTYVLHGDFHEIQWWDASVDAIYSNSLDHSFKIDSVIREIRRVLKPDGLLIVEAVRGAAEGHPPGTWESFYWSTVEDLVELLKSHALVLALRFPVEYPWPAEHLVLTRGAAPDDPALG